MGMFPRKEGHMPFVKDKTGSAQTAANASAVVVAAFAEQLGSFDAAVAAFNELRQQVFDDLAAIVDEDNKAFAAADSAPKTNGSSKSKSSNRSARGSSSRGSKTQSNDGGNLSLQDALGTVLNWGAFEGETLEYILTLDAETTESDYDYGDGERDGRDYIAWLASDKNKTPFMQNRARVIADAEGIEY